MPSAVLTSLHQDHINMIRVTRLAEKELAAIAAGESADLDLLEDVMRYVTGYPDAHHHPTEDVVFEQLKRRAPEEAGKINAILSEHEQIIAKGRRFLDAIEAAQEDAPIRRDDLVHRGETYFAALREHMNLEEGHLFPCAAKTLGKDDWRVIEERVGEQHDPLFGPALDDSYRALRERIEAHGGEPS